jgi:hypothetical protein
MIDDLKSLIRKTDMFFGLILLSFALSWFSLPQSAYADVEWAFGKQRNLDVAPVDIASSSDGQWAYLLTLGEIEVYSIFDDKVVSRIPIDKAFDRISYSAQTNSLIVSSSTAKIIRFIQLEFIQKFSLDGLAIKGPENAPVTIAVFSDYQ